MKKIAVVLVLWSSAMLAQVKETRQVADFSAIRVSQSIQLRFTSDEAKKVELEAASDEELRYLKTEVTSDGTLKIYIDSPKKLKRFRFGKLVARVSNPKLERVTATSSGEVHLQNTVKARRFELFLSSSARFEGQVQTDNLVLLSSSSARVNGSFDVANHADLTASSSAKMDLKLTAKTVEFTVSSSAKVGLEGAADRVTAQVSSSGNIDGLRFKTNNLNGTASSSGKMTFEVADTVEGSASSSGKVLFSGTARLGRVHTSSSGKVEKL